MGRHLLVTILLVASMVVTYSDGANVVKATLPHKTPKLIRLISSSNNNNGKPTYVTVAQIPKYQLMSADIKQAADMPQPPVVYIPHASVGAAPVRQIARVYNQPQQSAYNPMVRSLFQSAVPSIASSSSSSYQLQQPQQQRRFIRVYQPSLADASQNMPAPAPTAYWYPSPTPTPRPAIPQSPVQYQVAAAVSETQPNDQQSQISTYQSYNPVQVEVYVEPKQVRQQMYATAVDVSPPMPPIALLDVTPVPALIAPAPAPALVSARVQASAPTPAPILPLNEPVYESSAKSSPSTGYYEEQCPRIYGDPCKYYQAGLYAHPTSTTCYLQCDEFGTAYARPCAPGTRWATDYTAVAEPSLYNKCS